MEARLTGINRRETLQYLGYLGSPIPEELETEITRCEQEILHTARPRAMWRLFSLLPDGSLEGTAFIPKGRDVPELLKDCSRVILMAATLGNEAERLLRRSQIRDMSDAVILDAAASAAVENVCDNLCEDLEEYFAPGFLTDRFSPGYGDLSMSVTEDIIAILDATKRIGLSVTRSLMMSPVKSITAFAGVINNNLNFNFNKCEACNNNQNCVYKL